MSSNTPLTMTSLQNNVSYFHESMDFPTRPHNVVRNLGRRTDPGEASIAQGTELQSCKRFQNITSLQCSHETIYQPPTSEWLDMNNQNASGIGLWKPKAFPGWPTILVRRVPLDWRCRLRYQIFMTYIRLCLLVIFGNLLCMVIMATNGRLLQLSLYEIALRISINVLLTVTVRNEVVINALFGIFGSIPKEWPLLIRQHCAKVYHFGGIHSGSAISASAWLIVFNFRLGRDNSKGSLTSNGGAIVGLTIVLDLLMASIILSSHPTLRSKYHNTWECIHRYAGWAMLAFYWALFGIFVGRIRPHTSQTDRIATVGASALFWILLAITIGIIWPWLRLRKVDVVPEEISSKSVKLHFVYRNIPFCTAPRVSDHPLREWHAFAAIPEKRGNGFYVVIAKIGDCTRRFVDNPPKTLWTRSVPIRGVLYLAPIFRKIVLVATGSGIGPVLSLVVAMKVPVRMIWVLPGYEAAAKAGLIDDVLKADPDALIYDSTQGGRPDLFEEARRLRRESGAEAIFIISNYRTTANLVYRFECTGVPAFGPIFDS